MQHVDDLLEALTRELPGADKLLLGIGDLHLLASLQAHHPRLLLLDAGPRRKTAATQRLVKGDPHLLPLAPSSLDGVIAVTTLSGYADAAALLAGWAQHLRKGGCLLVAEPLIRSATLRRVQRLLGGPRFARPAEEITGLMLHAGFGEIRQTLAGSRGPTLLTRGQLREL